MTIFEYGDPTQPTMLLLHPAMLSGAPMVALAGDLADDYFIIAPDLSGHDGTPFVSAEAEAATLVTYLVEQGRTDLALVYGMSLGGRIAMELVADERLSIATTVIDGAPLYRRANFLSFMLSAVFTVQHALARLNPERMEESFVKQQGEEARQMAQALARIPAKDLRAFAMTCSHFSFPTLTKAQQQRLFFDYGAKDANARKVPMLQCTYPSAHFTVRNGYAHCEFAIKNKHAVETMLRACMALSK